MQLLLVPEQQIATGETSRTLSAFEGLFFRVGPLMAFEMLQSCKSSLTSSAHMWSRFIRLWWGEIGGFCVCIFGDAILSVVHPTIGR